MRSIGTDKNKPRFSGINAAKVIKAKEKNSLSEFEVSSIAGRFFILQMLLS